MSLIRPAAWVRHALLLASGAGLLFHFLTKDRYPWLDVAYYTLPLPVIAGLILVAGVLSLRLGQKRPALACFLLFSILVLLWMRTGAAWNRCDRASPDFKVLEWNTAHGRRGWDGIAAAIRPQAAGLIALVEADAHAPETGKFWKEQFPEYSVSAPGRGLVLLIRGDIQRSGLQEFGVKSRLAWVEARMSGQPLRVVLVDLEAHPLSRRKLLLERVQAIAATPFAGPTIVVGDFNTPGDSVWFEELRRDYSEAFEKAGRGFLATWPYPLPLLGLDHIWVSKELVPLCAGKQGGWQSDHALIWSEVAFASRLAGPPGMEGSP